MLGMRELTLRAGVVVALVTLGMSGCGNGTPTASPAGSSSAQTGSHFKLEEGFEHDVCGIGVAVKFIPATASSSKADFAVVYGGPINKVPDKVQDHTGADPLPDNAAHAVPDTTITVYGKQFKVDSVDVADSATELTALC
jgi:hypothetical protein